MENSETTEEVIKLGKFLVSELGLDRSTDTLQRWMAHHLAELINDVENATAGEKDVAQQKCFDAVLKLWSHRNALPGRSRPFQEFDKIFKTIKHIDPDQPRSFYADFLDDRSSPDGDSTEVEQWLSIVVGTDAAARELIQMCLSMALYDAESESTKEWLSAVEKLDSSDDVELIKMLQGQNDSELDQQQREDEIEKLKVRIDKLNAFVNNGQALSTMLNERLVALVAEAGE